MRRGYRFCLIFEEDPVWGRYLYVEELEMLYKRTQSRRTP